MIYIGLIMTSAIWIGKLLSSTQNKGITLALLGAVLMSFDPIFIKSSGVEGKDAAFYLASFQQYPC